MNYKSVGITLAAVLSLIIVGGIGFYYGQKSSPLGIGLSTLADIAYDEKAEAEFNIKIGILNAKLVEKDELLSEVSQRNIGLEHKVTNLQEVYYESLEELENKELPNNEREFELVSNDLQEALVGNKEAQEDLLELNGLFLTEKNLFQAALDEANDYITSLENSNRGLRDENSLLINVNKIMREENTIMSERIETISGSRARHGPGIAVGMNPIDEYGFAIIVGWTVSWS